jgi:hypothetical protein
MTRVLRGFMKRDCDRLALSIRRNGDTARIGK